MRSNFRTSSLSHSNTDALYTNSFELGDLFSINLNLFKGQADYYQHKQSRTELKAYDEVVGRFVQGSVSSYPLMQDPEPFYASALFYGCNSMKNGPQSSYAWRWKGYVVSITRRERISTSPSSALYSSCSKKSCHNQQTIRYRQHFECLLTNRVQDARVDFPLFRQQPKNYQENSSTNTCWPEQMLAKKSIEISILPKSINLCSVFLSQHTGARGTELNHTTSVKALFIDLQIRFVFPIQ